MGNRYWSDCNTRTSTGSSRCLEGMACRKLFRYGCLQNWFSVRMFGILDNFKYCNLLQSILHCSGNCRQRTNFVWRLGYRQQLPRLGSLQRHWRVTGWWCFIETRLRCNRKRHKITMCITTMICVQPFYLWIQLSVYDIISERNIDSIYKNLQIPSYVSDDFCFFTIGWWSIG